jgi:sister-chromatid-cohesion protein PDS5
VRRSCGGELTGFDSDRAFIPSPQSIARKLSTAEPDLLVAHTAVLAQFARLAPDAFERKSDVLMAFLVKKLLMVPSPADPVRSAFIPWT